MLSSYRAQIQAVPSSQPLKAEPERIYPCLDLCALPVYSSFPDTYSLLMVDSALTPPPVSVIGKTYYY